MNIVNYHGIKAYKTIFCMIDKLKYKFYFECLNLFLKESIDTETYYSDLKKN